MCLHCALLLPHCELYQVDRVYNLNNLSAHSIVQGPRGKLSTDVLRTPSHNSVSRQS